MWRPNVERDAQRRVNIRVTDEIVNRAQRTADRDGVRARGRGPPRAMSHSNECLIRMERDDGRVLLAPDIVPVAERLGLIRLVDHRVLELVVAELARCARDRAQASTSRRTPRWIRIWWASIESLMRAHPPGVARTADRRDHRDRGGPGPRRSAQLRDAAEELRQAASRSTISAPATPRSATSAKLGVDIVKIDGAFVQNIARSADDRAFVQTLIDLARRLQIKTVAEWVQDEEAAGLLRDWGCDYIQGRLIGLASAERAVGRAGGQGAAGYGIGDRQEASRTNSHQSWSL